MKSKLLVGVREEEVQLVSSRIKGILLDPALDYIREAIDRQTKEMKSADYDNPSWGFKQAHHNGYNQAIQEVLQLLDHKE